MRSVKNTNWMSTAYLLLGTNLGDRERNLEQVRKELSALDPDAVFSGVYATAAWGLTDQPDFLNQAACVSTMLSPMDLLDFLQLIEKDLGRTRSGKWSARTMDIDILYFDSLIMKDPRLELPHPHLHTRRFALTPLAEIAADFEDPATGRSVQWHLEHCSDPLSAKRL